MEDGFYVQYGCGWDAPDDWMNFDASLTLRIERIPVFGKRLSAIIKKNAMPFPDNVRYGDIVKGLPLGSETCMGIYCSHVLEHFCLDDFRKALINTRYILKTGGIFRLVLPDLAYYFRCYSENDSSDAALNFMRETSLGESVRSRGIRGLMKEFLSNSRHRWMWDYPSLDGELKQTGFGEIRRAEFGDSVDIKFNQVERKERWENCLGVECRRI